MLEGALRTGTPRVRRLRGSFYKALGALVTSAAFTALLSGCTPNADTTPPPTSTVDATPKTTPTISRTPTQTGSTATPTTSPASTAPRCAVSTLRGTWAGDSGAAGTFYGYVTLTNTGSSDCTLHGWPGISLVTGSKGTQLGATAQETSGTRNQQPVTITLHPNSGAKAQIGIATAQNYGSRCELQKANGFRVYPPGSYNALFVKAAVEGCRNTTIKLLTAAPLEPSK